MKKAIVILFTIVTIIVTIFFVKYGSYKTEYNSVLQDNKQFEEYKDKEIYGIE